MVKTRNVKHQNSHAATFTPRANNLLPLTRQYAAPFHSTYIVGQLSTAVRCNMNRHQLLAKLIGLSVPFLNIFRSPPPWPYTLEDLELQSFMWGNKHSTSARRVLFILRFIAFLAKYNILKLEIVRGRYAKLLSSVELVGIVPKSLRDTREELCINS